MTETAIQIGRGDVMHIDGPMDFDTVPGLLREARPFFRDRENLVFDLRRVHRADSAGLGLLLEWVRQSRRAGVALRFVNVPRQIRQIARASGLEHLLS